MGQALIQAGSAAEMGEVPVGALVVDTGSGQILSRAHNNCIKLNDPSAHAEILAIRKAAEARQNYRLANSVLVVTLEPCLMCVGALIQARLSGLVFGARDPKAGAVISRLDIVELQWVNHKFWFINGLLEDDCSLLLKNFFQNKRNRSAC